MSIKFKFRVMDEPVFSGGFYYDLFEGGNISPEELLEDDEQIEKVREAMEVVSQFLDQAESAGVLDIM